MIAFYPEFEANQNQQCEILIVIDASCSMVGQPLEDAKKLASLAVKVKYI
jgi:hypothetical protein